MFFSRNKMVSLLICFTILSMIVLVSPAKAAPGLNRAWGNDRYATAVAISRQGWTNSKYVVIATGENFPDALSAAPLAKKYSCPLLLTPKDNLHPLVKEELIRLGVDYAIIAGGEGVISENVGDQLGDLCEFTTNHSFTYTRYGGRDRYATSVRIAQDLENFDNIIVTTGEDFSDALSASSIAAANKMPILLVPRNYITEEISYFIKWYLMGGSKKVYIIGGPDIISDEVANKFPNYERITGNDKYERNINIVNRFRDLYNLNLSNIFIATGESFADALSGSVLAANYNSPIVLTSRYPSYVTSNFLKSVSQEVNDIIVFGGSGAVPDATVNTLISSLNTNNSSNNQSNINQNNNTGTSNTTNQNSNNQTNNSTNQNSNNQTNNSSQNSGNQEGSKSNQNNNDVSLPNVSN